MSVNTEGVDDVLLDRHLPMFEARQFSAVVVDASAERGYAALRTLDPDQVARSFPPMRALGWLRALPARLAAAGRRKAPEESGTLAADEANDAFVVLAEEVGREFVVGMVGKFMTATQLEFRRMAPDEFAEFCEPGYGKVALNFRVRPYGPQRCLVSTETRTTTTGPAIPRALPALLAPRRPLRWPDHAAMVAAGQAQRQDLAATGPAPGERASVTRVSGVRAVVSAAPAGWAGLAAHCRAIADVITERPYCRNRGAIRCSVEDYDAVVLGSASYSGHWLEPAKAGGPAAVVVLQRPVGDRRASWCRRWGRTRWTCAA